MIFGRGLGQAVFRCIGVSIVAVLAGTPAVTAQATLGLAGPHGNEAGCAFLKDRTNSSDERLVLTADAIEAYESYCEFVEVLTSKQGTAVITTLCGGEGETWISHMIVSPADPANGNRRKVFQSSGDLWGEVAPCE
jgi:hypothetical protein